MKDNRPSSPMVRRLMCTCGKQPIMVWSTCQQDPSKEVNLDALWGLLKAHNPGPVEGWKGLIFQHDLYVSEASA